MSASSLGSSADQDRLRKLIRWIGGLVGVGLIGLLDWQTGTQGSLSIVVRCGRRSLARARPSGGSVSFATLDPFLVRLHARLEINSPINHGTEILCLLPRAACSRPAPDAGTAA